MFDSTITSEGYPFPGTSALALYYASKGHKVSIITTGKDIRSVEVHRSRSVDLYVVPSRPRGRDRALDFFAAERRYLHSVLDEVRPDVIHAHWTYEFGLAARRASAPSLVTVHDWAPAIAKHNRHPYWYFRIPMQATCLLMPGGLSAPTKYLADKVASVFRQKVEIIPNGIDLAKYNAPRLDDGVVRVGMLNVGFSALKNVSKALYAWQRVIQELPTASLHLAGPGYEVDGEAHTWAVEHGLTQGVVFEGPVASHDVPQWFADKRLFLHSSLEESFGIVLIESMASGVPVIAGVDSGAVSEITQGAAELIDVRSVNAIAEAVVRTAKNDVLMDDMILRGRLVAQKFGLNSVGALYLKSLERCINPNS